MTMDFKSFFFCILLFYNVEAKLREVVCPDYCSCDIFKNFKRADCQCKKLVSAEIGIPPEVEILDLSYNQIRELGNRVFANDGLTELKLLNLSNNKISQIHMFAFEDIENLKSLDLSFNMLEYFLEQWFLNLQNLEELYLQGNNLALINKQPTLNLPSLKILNLSQSKIEYFNIDVFSLLPKLEILDISSNYMERINAEVFVPLTNLKLLLAKDNNLDCEEKSIPALRHLIRKNSINYVGPCIRTVRRIRTHRPNTEGSLSILNKPENSEYIIQDGSNKYLGLAAPAGYTGPPDKIGKSEKHDLNKDLDKITDELARYKTNDNYKILEKINKTPISGKVEDKINNVTYQDGDVEEKFIDKVQNSGIVEDSNKPDDRDKIAISSNLDTISDSEILGDLKNYISSDKFQKMKMESPSPINKIDSYTDFNKDDKLKISENNKTEKINDDDLVDELKKFLQYEKLKKVSVSDSNTKLEDLKYFTSSTNFEKIRTSSPVNKLDHSAVFTNDKKLEISEYNNKEKINDDNLIDKIKNLLQIEKLKNDSLSDSNAKLGDLKYITSSDKFQKMKMESPSPINKLDNSAVFKNDDKLEISENNKPEKNNDDNLIDKLKNFLQFEKLKKDSESDSNDKLVGKTQTNTPEMSDESPNVPEIAEKNAWMVDDEKSKIDSDKNKMYANNCNGTKKVNFNNVLDKMAMEIIEISPSLILTLFTLFGIMLGLVIGCSVQIKEIPKLKEHGSKFVDLFNRRKPKNKEQAKNEMNQGDVKIPIQEDVAKKVEENEQQSAMHENDDESDDCNICEEEEEEMLRKRKDKNKKSPFEDQTLLLDNELAQDGTTPMLGKKDFSSTKN